MKKIYMMVSTLLLLCLGVMKTNAQVSSYIFSQSNGTYIAIPEGDVNATLLDSAYYGSTTNTMDTKGWAATIPFTFNFNSVDYTSLYVNSNGGISFGATTSTVSSIISSTGTFSAAIAPMSRDLWGAFVSQGTVTSGSPTITGVTDFYGIEVGKPLRNTTGVPTTATVAAFDIGAGTITMSANATANGANVGIGWGNGEVRTFVTGTAPNRVFIIEWKDFSDYSTTANTRSVLNFQVHLEETSNEIHFVYGTNSQNVTTSRTSQVGLRGAANTDYNNRSSATDWSATIAGTSNTASVTRTDVINPASGLTFTWTVPSCFSPSGLNSSAVTASGATIAWTAATPAPANGYEYYYSTSNTAPTSGTTPSGSTGPGVISANLSGLPDATVHYFWVRSVCGGSDVSNWVGPAQFATLCNAVSSFTENWDAVTASALPVCFNKVGTLGTVNTQTTNNSSAPNTLYIYASSTANEPTLALRPVNNAGAGTHRLRFKLRANLTIGGVLDVGYLTNPTDATSFVSVQTVTAASLTYTEYTVSPGTAPGANQHLALRAKGSPAYSMLLDDLSWEPIPSCIAPTSLITTAVSTNGANIAWTAANPAPANGYDYYYSDANIPPTAGTTPSGSTGAGIVSASLGGLTANTLYYFWVRSNCGSGDLSTWSGPSSFFTGYCVPAATSSASFINNFTTTGGAVNISNLASGFTTGGYQDNYATMGATVTAGASLGFSMDITGTTVGAAIWVDFNNNLIFEADERLFNTTSYSGSPLAGSLAIAGATTAGDYRMRVLIDYNASNPTNPCGFGSGRGEVEDYKLTVLAQPTDAMDWVNLQFPATATITAGSSETIYTRGYEPGVTEAAGAGTGITVWIGISPVGAPTSSDPATWTTWIPATFNVQVGNDDEFSAAIGSTLAPGTYQYASRWQLNGGPFRYGGYNAGGGGFWDGTNNVSGVLTVNALPNDVCAGAVSIPVNTTCVYQTFNTGGATDNNETGDCTAGTEKAVWFSFVATQTYAVVTVDGSANFDAVLGVISACGTTTVPTGGACVDATGDDGIETLNLSGLTVGNTYYVQVYEYGGDATTAATFDICVVSADCPAPTSVSVGTVTSVGASVTWVGTGNFILEYGLDGFTPGTGASAGVGGTIINPATSPQLIAGLAASTVYDVYIRQDCTGAGAGFSANASASFTTLAPPPANDECANAVAIGVVPVSSTNNSATQTLAPISCQGFTSSSAPDVWFQFTTTSSGSAIVALTNAVSIDAILEAFTGTCGSLTSIGCADGSATATGNETLTLNGLTTGQTIYVRVYGWNGDMGTFDIAVSGGALPVSIEYFTGTKQAGKNRLDWKINCYNSPTVKMTLQRSADGRNYTDLVTLTETAVRCLTPFNQTDLNPLAGINYYRLKTVDVDGKVSYSNVVALLNQTKGFELVSLAPNPVMDKAMLNITSAEASIMEIVVSDLNGKQLSKQRVNLIAGSNQIPLNLVNIPAGTYQVSGLTTSGELRTIRFVKQ